MPPLFVLGAFVGLEGLRALRALGALARARRALEAPYHEGLWLEYADL